MLQIFQIFYTKKTKNKNGYMVSVDKVSVNIQ